MRKVTIIIITGIFILSNLYGSDKKILLKIPVRVYKSKEYIKELKITDFDLQINKVKRNIKKLITGERSLSEAKGTRSFVFSFNLTDYGKNITKGISYFVDNILRKTDNLIVWTPVKIYRIKTNLDKTQIISDIKKIVKNDSLLYKKTKFAAREKLLNIVNEYLNFIEHKRDSNPGTDNIIRFLNGYSREWINYKTKYLIPDMGKYYGIVLLLSHKYKGEKYFINFQQREIIPSLRKYERAKKNISDYLFSIAGTNESSRSSSISGTIKRIDKSLLLSDNFDPALLNAPLKGANISYNVIFFHSFRQTGENSDSISPDYEGILRDIAHSTGGLSVNTSDIEKGLDLISNKKDFYYNLIFGFNGKKGEKKVKISITDKSAGIFYKESFSSEEIENLIKISGSPSVKISEVSVKGSTIKFEISQFEVGKNKNNPGIIKVDIKLSDKNNNTVFKKGNTLRADKKSVKISLNIKPDLKGFFKLEITVKDMVVNRETTFEKYIEIK